MVNLLPFKDPGTGTITYVNQQDEAEMNRMRPFTSSPDGSFVALPKPDQESHVVRDGVRELLANEPI